MRHTEIDEARFLAAGNDLDGKAERGLGAAQERAGVLRHAQRVRSHHAHGLAGHAREALGKALQRGERAFLGLGVEVLVAAQPGAEAHCFLERVERIDLVVDDAADGQVEAVGAEVDRAEGGIFH
jgi:hypothetical protein